MRFRGLFLLQALVVAIVGVIHVIAMEHHLYWHYVWLDVPVHFLGGLWLGLLGMWIAAAYRLPRPIAFVISFVIVVSIGWEIFEIYAGIPMEANFVFDTALDLVMDGLGATVGYFIARVLAPRVA